MAKRNKAGQFVKGGGRKGASSSGAKSSKGKGAKGKSSKRKGMAKHAHDGLAAARAEYMIKKPVAGDTVAAAIKKLQHNQAVIAHGLTAVADEVVLHRRALLGAGLIAARGGA